MFLLPIFFTFLVHPASTSYPALIAGPKPAPLQDTGGVCTTTTYTHTHKREHTSPSEHVGKVSSLADTLSKMDIASGSPSQCSDSLLVVKTARKYVQEARESATISECALLAAIQANKWT